MPEIRYGHANVVFTFYQIIFLVVVYYLMLSWRKFVLKIMAYIRHLKVYDTGSTFITPVSQRGNGYTVLVWNYGTGRRESSNPIKYIYSCSRSESI